MPLCTLYLARLDRTKSDVDNFLLSLLASPVERELVTACRVRFPVISSTTVDANVLNNPWDILLLFVGSPEIPQDLRKASLVGEYKVSAGVYICKLASIAVNVSALSTEAPSDPFANHPKLQTAQL
jgi:hypothetical protein